MPDEIHQPDIPTAVRPHSRSRVIVPLLGAIFAPFVLLGFALWALHTLVEKPEWEQVALAISVLVGCGFIAYLPWNIWIRILIGVFYVPLFTFLLFLSGWIFLTAVLDRPMKQF